MQGLRAKKGEQTPKTTANPDLFPRMFPRFEVVVNVRLCTSLLRAALISQ